MEERRHPPERPRPGTRRQSGVLFPILLIGLGTVLLLNTLGMLEISLISLVRYWPVLLEILAGLDVLFGGRSLVGNLLLSLAIIAVLAVTVLSISSGIGSADFESVGWPLPPGVEAIDATLDFSVGELDVGSLPASSDGGVEVLYRPLAGRGMDWQFDVDGEQTAVLITDQDPDSPFRWWNNRESRMDVELSREVPLRLDAQAGAGQVTLDLTDFEVEELNAELGAGQLTVLLPQEGAFQADLTVGAGELTVVVPDGLAVRIRSDAGLGATNIDQSRFERLGDDYVTRGLDSTDTPVVVSLDVGFGVINVR